MLRSTCRSAWLEGASLEVLLVPPVPDTAPSPEETVTGMVDSVVGVPEHTGGPEDGGGLEEGGGPEVGGPEVVGT